MFIKRVTAVALAAFLLFSSVILRQVAAADTASLTAASAADSTLQPDVAEASNSTALPAEGAAKPDRATAGLTPLEKKLEPATVKEAANKPEVASNEEKKEQSLFAADAAGKGFAAACRSNRFKYTASSQRRAVAVERYKKRFRGMGDDVAGLCGDCG